jgi:ribosomal protein L39E
MKNINRACPVWITGTWLTANKYTGNRKKEKWNRSSCMVERAIIKTIPAQPGLFKDRLFYVTVSRF